MSETILEMLKKLKEENNFPLIDETVLCLIKLYKEKKLRSAFGLDKGRITLFTKDDRIEDHNDNYV